LHLLDVRFRAQSTEMIMSQRPVRFWWPEAAALLLCLVWVAGCSAYPVPAQSPRPTPAPSSPQPSPSPQHSPSPTPADPLALPAAFRYEVTLRPAGLPDEPASVITGQYRKGAWSQSARYGGDEAEDLVVAPDGPGGPLRSYTRQAGEPTWTRWPGEGFDAGYGLASPFSVLRLYALADERASGAPEALEGVAENVTKAQTAFSADTVQRLLRAGVSVVAVDPEERSALEAQLAPLFVPQTVTYWAGEEGRIYQAAATLLTAGPAGEPAPWLEVVWRFWGYDDPAIAVTAPAASVDAGGAGPADQPAAASSPEVALDPRTNLRVRTFALPGVPVDKVKVTVYPAGKKKAVGSSDAQDAQFVLPAGIYDVQVSSGGAEEWLKGLATVDGSVLSQDVVFDFGTLALTVVQGGATPQVDIVIYPAGQRQTWADYRAENPTSAYLRAGMYDVEVALPDFTGSKVVEGIEVRSGETVSQTITLDQ
jgi:hypothetical protein